MESRIIIDFVKDVKHELSLWRIKNEIKRFNK
jgi:hypothetical protein